MTKKETPEEKVAREDYEERRKRWEQNPESAPFPGEAPAAAEAAAEAEAELPAPTDDDIRAVITDLDLDGKAEKTKSGAYEMSAINEALKAKGFGPVKAADRDRVTAS